MQQRFFVSLVHYLSQASRHLKARLAPQNLYDATYGASRHWQCAIAWQARVTWQIQFVCLLSR